ncbi:hypothetical protein GIB67_035798 [Kingdonia uniflora]|uniref:Reticulon-like protein n=1 Tax=Kingdonia uniflora TaxID=39325 RepID=A0A7J7MJK6_9MAGN|nr:hypothetical protein GIB67_035798 [Kingdonia uniflora]
MEDDLINTSSPILSKSVHQSLGGGAVADVLLWKRWSISAFLLVISSIIWLLFERVGYNLLSLVANVLLLLLFILFFWAKSASLLNRPLPPLPNMEVSDDFIGKASEVAQVWVNRVLGVAHDIALGGDYKYLFFKDLALLLLGCVQFVACFFVGNVFNFLSLVYMGVLFSLSIPVLYNKYQDTIDVKLSLTHRVLSEQYRKLDEKFLSKIPKPSKEKKTQ